MSDPAPDKPAVPPSFALIVAVLAVSWGGPLVRFTEAPALAVAAWRLALSVAFILLVVLARAETRRLPELSRREWLLAVASGVLLAAHFWSWIASLELTSVASSVVLVNVQPVFVATLSVLFLGERPTRMQWTGIGVAVAGAAVIGWGDWGGGTADGGRDPLTGDLLALAGAAFVSGYYVIGRGLRQRLDLWHYIAIVYGVAAVVLLAAATLHPRVALTGYAPRDWWIFVALAAGPMMLGHTGVNYALRYLRAYVANLALLAEPVGATLIAWLLPGIAEVPPGATLAGGALILAGIALGTLSRRRTAPRAMAAPRAHTQS